MRRYGSIGEAKAWVTKGGFASAVGLAIILSAFVAATVVIPADVPAVALEAAAVYRLEVGGALFLGLYLVAMTFFLALHNRGFSEISTNGVRAQNLEKVSETVMAQEGSVKLLFEIVDELRNARDAGGGDR